MKRLFFLFIISLFFAFQIQAEENSNEVRDLQNEVSHIQTRGIVTYPHVYYGNGCIYVLSEIPIQNLSITIKDQNGTTVCSETINILSGVSSF